ncbi:MAG: hypothetical protein H3C35_11120 [Bacteroidetes bacterium]|nr:hypothetical protein [Bacteroidota bacterium]
MAARKKSEEKEVKAPLSTRKSSALTVKSVIEEKLKEFGLVLRDEFERQVFLANSELRTYIVEERRESRRWRKIVLALLAVVGMLIILNIYLMLHTTESSVKSAVASEFAAFEDRQSKEVKTILVPMKENVEQNLGEVTNQLALSRSYIDVYALEGLARSGSRTAFEELQNIARRGGEKGRFANAKITDIKYLYSVLKEPKRKNLTLGEVSVVRAGSVLLADSLSDMELLYVMNSANATIPQVHHLMSLLWNKRPNYDMENEYWNILQNSHNLAASVAVCSLLKNYYGQNYDIYDFGKWKTYLEKRMQ